MKNGIVCLLVFLGLGHCSRAAFSATALSANGLNVLLIVTDDQRPDTISALGNRFIKTPNLDDLAKRGMVFTRAVCPYPLCVPSRAELLSGRSSFHNGVLPGVSNRLDPNLILLPQALGRAGYQTCYVGKWHTSGRPSTCGYEESLALFGSGVRNPPEQRDANGRVVTGYRGWAFQTDDRKLFPERGVGLTANISQTFGDAAVEYIRRAREKPFFLHVNFTGPHDPLLMPPGYEGKYAANRLPLPPNYLSEHPFDHGNFNGRDEKLLPWPRTTKDVLEELAVYYAVISHIDAQVGRMVAALRETKQLAKTLIIFTSDHGLAIGSHGLRGKQNMYDHTIGAPLLISGANAPRNQRSKAQVYLRDIYPTICELVGAPIPETVESKSFADVIRGHTNASRRYVFGYFHDVQRMIRGDRWKLIYYPKLERYQLFDLAKDPHELHDVSGAAGVAAVQDDLRRKLEAWQRKANDPLAKPLPK